MKLMFIFLAFFTLNSTVRAQSQLISTRGGAMEMRTQVECIPQHVRQLLNEEITKNLALLRINTTVFSRADVLFQWPLRLAAGRPNLPYYVIGNLVDLNPALSNQITDYNCGIKSYDNHSGIDIGTTPFDWLKMDNNDVEVIAAAAGTIVARREGDFDRNCGASATTGNYITVLHSDGAKSIYYQTHIQDGIYFSSNGGATFVKVVDFVYGNLPDNAYADFRVNVDSLITRFNLSWSSNFIIRFQQHDIGDFSNYVISACGLYLDNIDLRASSTGTQDAVLNNALCLAPNPATHQLFVDLKNTQGGIFRLQIADALGRVRTVQTVNTPQTMLSIADLPNGLYWLTMTTTDGRQAVQKFIKQ